MRYLILTVVVAVFSAWGVAYHLHCGREAKAEAAEHAEARRIASLISSADFVVLRREGDEPEEGLTVRDSAWIRNVSNAVAGAQISKKVHCLCFGWRTAHFTRDRKEIVRVAAIHGNQLRIYWDGDGGDFPIDDLSWKAIAEALQPPAGQGSAAPAGH